ncbi:MAG TPA: ATPase, T2SS/T4P/T4SS family [Tepidisphaeraceae bacterium]|jgi:type II secretory ATPase GspE/PulE/Tfp pilus assembly ATPase PilB-like protein|nr:ATPase, T2SS/T4P/T4SS family [Tepidisphaeraceae bacterium]
MLAFDPMLAAQGGGYISTPKVVTVLVVLALWARLLTWADKDAPAAHLPRTLFNLANLGGMVVAFALFFYVPTFILGFLVLAILLGAEAGVYLAVRNKHVGLRDLQKQFRSFLEGFKSKKDSGAAAAGQVTIMGKDGKPLPVPESDSPDRAAYEAVQKALTDPIRKSAQRIDIAPDGDGMTIKYMVDNVSHVGGSIDRAAGTAAIAYMKWAGGMNIEDRRKPQTAVMKVVLDKQRHELRVQTAGTTAGEYLRMAVDPKGRHTFKLADLGFTELQRTAVQEMVKNPGGLVILSAPKGHGLTSLFYSILRSHDAFLEHAHTVEHDQEEDLEGITQNKLASSASAAEEAHQVDWVISQEPDVLGVSNVAGAQTAAHLIEFAKSKKRVYVCMRANSTFEALETWKKLVADTGLATESLRMVINGRVMRQLCEACKEGFAPDPAMLKKLNLSPERATTLYKAREQPIKDAKGNPVPCEFCHDLRYKGRVGVFEILTVDGEVKASLDAGKSLSQAFRKQKGRYLQEEALERVEHGQTSVQEVLRVLKPAPEGEAKPAARAAPAAAAAPVRNRAK